MVNTLLTSTSWLTNYSSLIGILSLKNVTLSLDFKMSLPTAQSYVFETLMENLSSVEKDFLKPNKLLKNLTKTEEVLSEVVEVLSEKDLLEEIAATQKVEMALLVQRLAKLEKASQEKLSWANQFSDYLQSNINTK